MAILKPFECRVCVDGVLVEEYADDDEQASAADTVTKYIEAVSGATFTLKFTALPMWHMDCDFLSWSIDLDGANVTSGVVPREKYCKCHGFTEEIFGVKSGAGDRWVLNRFKFADIITGDLPEGFRGEDLKKKYKDLGLITVKVWRKKLHSVTPASASTLAAPRNHDTGPIPEKALKGQALSLSTGLGPDEETAGLRVWNAEKVDRHPLAVFNFKYRSRLALQQLLIFPRSPTPVPLEERDPEQLTRAETQELIRRQRVSHHPVIPSLPDTTDVHQARLASIEVVKQERSASAKRERSNTLAVGSSRPMKVARTSSGQAFVDLDDSDDEVVKIGERPARRRRPEGETEVINLSD